MESLITPIHSQRAQVGSLGLVLERERLKHEIDALQWYIGEKKEIILYEETFHCVDLGVQLKPLIERFSQSEQYKTQCPLPKAEGEPKSIVPYEIDENCELSAPFHLFSWLESNRRECSKVGGKKLPFHGETLVLAFSGASSTDPSETLRFDVDVRPS